MIGAIIGGATSLANTFLGNRAAKKERGFQREMATTAYQRDVEMFERANAYNTPQMQRKRLEEAGLNPALMYKTQPQNVAVQTPKHQSYNTPVYKPDVSDIMNIMGQYVAMKGQKLKNEEQSIVNSFLSEIKSYEAGKKGMDYEKARQETEIDTKTNQSLFQRKYQQEINDKLVSNSIKKIMEASHKTLPPWARAFIPMLTSVIK